MPDASAIISNRRNASDISGPIVACRKLKIPHRFRRQKRTWERNIAVQLSQFLDAGVAAGAVGGSARRRVLIAISGGGVEQLAETRVGAENLSPA